MTVHSAHPQIVIHMDRRSSKPHTPENPHITVWDGDANEVVATGKTIVITGRWRYRQYNNPVPCGATVMLFPDWEHPEPSTWEVIT